jgi:tetratricopeptide (TPR) repeat protein
MAVTQEFHISVTPIGGEEYLVRTERVAPGVPIAEEKVRWPVRDWLQQAGVLMNDPLRGLLRGEVGNSSTGNASMGTARNAASVPTLPSEESGASGPNDAQNGSSNQSGSSQGASNQSASNYASSGNATANLISLGKQLYEALFQGSIRDSWMRAQGIAQHRQEILRLRLGLKDDLLPRLPWEVLHAGDRPISTGTEVVFCRYHSGFSRIAAPLQFSRPPSDPYEPLRILMVVAAPSDQARLALNKEIEQLQAEVNSSLRDVGANGGANSQIELTILDQPGREELTQALEHRHYHVMHYAGHSNLGETGGDIYLVSRQTGLTETLSGEDLAGLLANNGIQMAVFNSCRGSYTAASDGTGNLAQALVRRGIPAVLAMAERIPDNVALNLSRLFYRNLKRAYPIDLSLNRARQGLISSYSSDQLYWALPILYLQSDFDGYLQPPLNPQDATRLEEELLAPSGMPRSGGTVLAPQPSQTRRPQWEDSDEEFDPDDLEFEDSGAQDADQEMMQLLGKLSQGAGLAAGASSTISEAAATDEVLLPDAPPKPPIDPVAHALRLTQIHPQDAGAHEQLGLAYLQRNSLDEAVKVLNQAIALDENRASGHNSLGLALAGQGAYTEAIQSYNRAIQLDPTLAAAYENLKVALQRQQTQGPVGLLQRGNGAANEKAAASEPAAATQTNLASPAGIAGATVAHRLPPPGSGGPSLTPVEATLSGVTGGDRPIPQAVQTATKPGTSLLQNGRAKWVGLTAAGVVLLGSGAWLVGQLGASNASSPILVSPPAISDLESADNATIISLAYSQLKQNNLEGVKFALVSLLDPKRSGSEDDAAKLALKALERQNSPEFQFLLGRAHWQKAQKAEPKSAISLVDDARRAWETAVQKENSDPRYRNALGAAYYAQGRYDRASETWQQVERTLARLSTPLKNGDYLTATAGMALAQLKLADQQKSAERKQAAVALHRRVMSANSSDFQTDKLAQQWLWSQTMLKDWQALGKLK